MFKEKRTLLFLTHQAGVSFTGKRWAYEGEQKEKKEAEAPKEKQPTPQELLAIGENMETKDEYVKFKPNADETLNDLAKELYESEKNQKAAKQLLVDTLGGKDGITKLWEDLKKQKCQYIRLDKGTLKFYKGEDFEKESNKISQPDVKIKTPTVEEEKKKKSPQEEAKERETAEKAAALEDFKKAFPQLKKSEIKVGDSEYGGARIPRSRDFKVYNSSGIQTIDYEQLGDYTAGAKIRPYKISVKAPNGYVDFVYIETTINGSIKQGVKFEGWVPIHRLSDLRAAAPKAEVEEYQVGVNTKAVEQQALEEEEAEAAKKKRSVYVDAEGIVHFKTTKEFHETTLVTIFPKAKKGDQVMVTHNGVTTTATFNGKDWVDENKVHVPIYDKDKVIPLTTTEYQAEKPKAPQLAQGESLLDTNPRRLNPEQLEKAKAGTLLWNDIARAIIAEFPGIKDQFMDYKGKNETERTEIIVKKYAKMLPKYANDKGYYWVFSPAKETPSAEEVAAEEIAKGKEKAKKATEKGAAERDARANELYNKHKDNIWGDKKYYLTDNLNALVSDEAKWKEAWDKNYPINAELIKSAFKTPPFNGISETKIRNGVRDMMKKGILSKNGFDFSDLLTYFNSKGELYKTLDGKPATSASDVKNDWKFMDDLQPRIEENRSKGRIGDYGFDEKEKKAYWGMEDRRAEILQLLKGTAVIFEAMVYCIQPEAMKPQVETKPVNVNFSQFDLDLAASYRKFVYENKSMAVPEKIRDYVNDEQKWKDFWEHDKGNVQYLKKALQRPPFNKLSLGAARDRIRDAMYASVGPDKMDMADLLKNVNKEGEVYKNHDGKPGRYSDFEKEYYLEQIGDKKRKGKTLSEDEQKAYDDCDYKEQLGDRYNELMQLWVSSAHVFNAVAMLDPEGTYTETVEPAKLPQALLDEVFPPNDTGSINGNPQDYYDTYSEEGTRIAGGGFFTGGLFTYDFRDRAKGITEFDMLTSNATANRIILDQCSEFDGKERKINMKKLQSRLNELIKLGIAKLITEPDSPQKAEVMKTLNITEDDLKKPTVINDVAKRFEIDFSKAKSLTSAQKDLVHLGFLLETVAKPGEVKRDVSETPVEWSTDPGIRKLQEQAMSLGASPKDMPKISEEVQQQIIAILHMKVGKNFSNIEELGLTVPIPIAGKDKNVLFLAIQPAYNFSDGRVVLRGGIGGSVELAKGVALIGGVGASTEGALYAGGGVSWDIPVDKDTIWEPNITLGAMASIKPTDLAQSSVIIGTALMFTRNLGKQFEADLQQKIEQAGYADVEKATDIHTKAELLRNLPGPNGVVLKQIDWNLRLTDEQLVNLYEQHIRKSLELQTAQAGLSEHKFLGFLPPITAAGVGLGVKLGPGGPTIVPGLAFAISLGSELVIFQRPVTSTEAMMATGEEKMTKDAETAIRDRVIEQAKKAGYTKVRFESSPLVGDMESGLKPVKSSSSVVANTPPESLEQDDLDKAFEKFNKELQKKGMKLEKEGKLYKLTVIADGNLQVYVDPQMAANTGVFLKDGGIYISANKNPELVIKRFDAYYPRPKEGNVKHTIVTISDQDFRTQRAIIEESDFYLDSRTLDNTGESRTALNRVRIDSSKESKQGNLLVWNKDEKYGFDTLDTPNAQLEKYQKEKEKAKRAQGLSIEARTNIGSADLEAVDVNKIRKQAQEFINDPKYKVLYRQLTTYQLKTKPQLEALNKAIKTKFPNLTDDELTVFKEELFNLSMSETEKLSLPQKKAIMRQRIEWMKTAIYIPFFKERLNDQNNPNHYSAEQVAEAFLAPLRNIDLEKNPEAINIGARLDVAVGSENILGTRGVIVGEPDKIPLHRLYAAKDYRSALLTGEPPMDKTIALVFRESQRPLETLKDNEFLKSPWAIKLMLLGTDKGSPVLFSILGEEKYKQLVACYNTRPPHIESGAEDTVKELRDITKKLNDAQEGKGGTPMLIGSNEYQSIVVNGIRLAVRTLSFKSGVYERCLNASNLYDDEIVALKETEKYTMVGNMRAYDAAGAQSLTSSMATRQINLGFGATVELGPRPPSNIPPGGGGNGTPGGGSSGEAGQGEQATSDASVDTGG